MTSPRLRIALQKKGRLSQESISLLQKCGLQFRIKDNALLTHVENFPIDLLFVRDDDIPTLIFDGLTDGGIVGENVLYESTLRCKENQYQTVLNLGSCRCRLAIAVPDAFNYNGPGSLEGLRIATSYPLLLQQFLNRYKITAECLTLSGSVEVAPRLGMADAICDLVSSGQTLEDNQLVAVETILESQATFIQACHPMSVVKQELFTMLTRRIQGVQQALERKYIVFHAPKSELRSICSQLPGVETPTIIELPGNPNLVAVHVVSTERIFWNTLEKIQTLGASSILVLPIEKMLE